MTESIEGADGDLVEMRVVAGRTIQVSNPWRMEKQVNATANGPEVVWVKVPIVGGKHSYAAGETVHLSREEATQLHQAGYVKFPDEDGETRPRPSAGATITGDDGPGLVHTATR